MSGAAPMVCLACRYDVTGMLGRVCPECGTEINEETVQVWKARASFGEAAAPTFRKLALGAAAAVCVCVGGVAGLTWEPEAVVGAALVLSVAIGGSLAAAAVPLAMVEREDRWVCFVAWVRALWWLHLPWLVIPGCTALLAGVGFAAQMAGADPGTIILSLCMIGLVCWLFLLLVVLFGWAHRWGDDLGRLGLERSRAAAVGPLVALAVLGGAAVVGFGGGVIGAGSVLGWFDPVFGFP